MAATLGSAVVQPPREGCLDPVITVDILELRIEEKSDPDAHQDQKVPSGHSVNIDVISMAHFHDFTHENVGASLPAIAEYQSPHR
jgi:hypothetical protein